MCEFTFRHFFSVVVIIHDVIFIGSSNRADMLSAMTEVGTPQCFASHQHLEKPESRGKVGTLDQ